MRATIRAATLFALSATISLSIARPVVTELNAEATAEAQQRDGTATRAFSSVEIKVCLSSTFRDEISC